MAAIPSVSAKTAAPIGVLLAYSYMAGLLYAPMALAIAFGGLPGHSAGELASAGLLQALAMVAPVLVVRRVKLLLWGYLALAAVSALFVAFVAAFRYLPHAGTYMLVLEHAHGLSFMEFVRAEWGFVVTASLLFAGYVALLASSRVPDLVVSPRVARAVVAAAGGYAIVAGLAQAGRAAGGPPSWRLMYPCNVLVAAMDAWDAKAEIEHGRKLRDEAVSQFRKFRFGVTAAPPPTAGHLQVLILGESSRYDHWGINGYERDTSPRLARYGGERLISFADVAAPANYTLRGVSLALSEQSVHALGFRQRKPSVVTLFREAGFETHWLSNQDATVVECREAEHQRFINPDWEFGRCQDTELLGLLDQALARPARNQLIVLHTMGNHFGYSSRYTEAHARFGTGFSDSGYLFPSLDRQTMVDQYDNSILAVDSFIDAVARRVEATGRDGLVTFMSDHGECLFDDERMYRMHTTPTSSKAEVHVPLFFLPTSAYRRAHPERVAALRAHRAWKATQDDMIWWLADLAGIRHTKTDPRRCIGNPAYVPPKVRLTALPDGRVVTVESLR